MPEVGDSEIDEDTLPTRGRRAAPKSRFATASAALLDPIAPLVARIAAWVSAHRLGVLLTAAVIVAVTAIGSGAALMRTVSETAFSEDPETSTTGNRPTPESTDADADADGDGPQGPILPTATPAPPFRVPEPTTAPTDAPAPTVPDSEPTAEPEPSDTPEPTTDHPGNGKGKGNPGGPNKPD